MLLPAYRLFPRTRWIHPLVMTALLLIAMPGHADAPGCTRESERCVEVGTWEFKVALGAGLRTNPVVGSDDVPLVLIPQVTYYGERFFLDNLDLGYTLVDERHWMLNALVTATGDGLYFFENDWSRLFLDGGLNPVESPFQSSDRPREEDQNISGDNDHSTADPDKDGQDDDQNGSEELSPSETTPALRDRHVAALAGLEASGELNRIEWQLQALSDVSGVHDGQTLRFALGSALERQKNRFGLSVGFNWKSAEVMEYYYGVTQGESGQARPAYDPGSGASPFMRLSWSRPTRGQWQWLGSVQFEHLSDAMRRSPLIDQDQVTQVFIGGVYHF